MSKTVLEGTIASRPVYGLLQARPGRLHLMVGDAEGAQAILDVAAAAPSGFLEAAHIIYIPGRTGETFIERLEAVGAAQLHVAPTYAAAAPRLRRVLSSAQMGLQLYLAGTEGLIGQAMLEATQAGFPHSAIQTEHRGSTARRVQCVHCKGITENVTHDPFQCSHCGLHLFVRDHYSRRIAAFQGVRVDAEAPGNVPAPLERFK